MFKQRTLEQQTEQRLARYLDHINHMHRTDTQPIVEIGTLRIIKLDLKERGRRPAARESVLTAV